MSLTYVVKVDCHRESFHTHWIQGKHQGSTFIYVTVKKTTNKSTEEDEGFVPIIIADSTPFQQENQVREVQQLVIPQSEKRAMDPHVLRTSHTLLLYSAEPPNQEMELLTFWRGFHIN